MIKYSLGSTLDVCASFFTVYKLFKKQPQSHTIAGYGIQPQKIQLFWVKTDKKREEIKKKLVTLENVCLWILPKLIGFYSKLGAVGLFLSNYLLTASFALRMRTDKRA